MNTNPPIPLSQLDPYAGHVLLFKGRGLISKLIRWQTRSCYSHAALLLPSCYSPAPTIIESWQGAGVRKKIITDWEDVDIYQMPEMSSRDWTNVFDWAFGEIGKPYDYTGVFRFMTRENAQDCKAWFCSAYVYRAFEMARIYLLHNRTAREVSPAMLSWSPLLFKL